MYNLQVRKNISKMSKSYKKFTFQKMPLLSDINTVQKYKMIRHEMYNLQTRLVQFKEQKKAKNLHHS